ncbi:MAG: glycosyltransferase family 2 protein [Paludibacter sp.]
MNYINVKVSIITPSYNQGNYLEETILSVLNQSYQNIEYIIIDGGSSDQSVEVIRKYEDRINFWVSEPDKGQADAINKGLKKASGDLVCWINSDDLLYPNFVSDRVRQFAENESVDFIYGDVDQGIDLTEKSLRKGEKCEFETMLLTLRVPIPQQSTMWRKSMMDKIGYLEQKWHVLLDREYFMRIAFKTKILYIPGSVGFFRNHEQSKSVAEWSRWAEELEVYYHQLFSDKEVEQEYGKYKSKAMSAMYYESASICRDCGDKKNAAKFVRKAASENLIFVIKKEGIVFLVKFKKQLRKYLV